MISMLVPEVCRANVEEYKNEVNQYGWRAIAEVIERRWDVPHAVEALDAKNVFIRCLPGSGSLFHNDKGFSSGVLLAPVDIDYKLLLVDVGGMGYMADSPIFNASELKEYIDDGTIGLHDPELLIHDGHDTSYFILCDDDFV